MMIRRGLIMVLTLFIALAVLALPAGADTPESYLDFAKTLFEQKDYYRAVTEAKRFLFFTPEHPRRAEAELLMARAYFRLGEYTQAREFFGRVIDQKKRPDLAETAVWELGQCLEVSARPEALTFYRELIEKQPLPGLESADIKNKAGLRLGWLLLEDGQWAESSRIFSEIDRNHPAGGQAGSLAEGALAGRDLPYVNPTTAGALSAVLPGAGQLYTHRPVDAALAFGLNAAFLWGTVEAYQKESWAVFSLLGLMEIALYGGNIYNAVNGAHIHNNGIKRNFIEKLKREHRLTLGFSPRDKAPVLVWSFRY